MKENARLACEDGGGADYLAGRIAQLQLDGHPLELHLVGHSAGSILLGRLLPELYAWGLKVKTLTLYAPACTCELFKANYVPYVGQAGCVERLTVFNLNDKHEQDDSVIGVYNKSLLYLVSEAFEDQRKVPLLGMDKHLAKDDVTAKLLGPPARKTRSASIYSTGGPSVTLHSASTSHGGFDNDRPTLNSTLRIVRGSNKLLKAFSG
jgi:hypothetical protein